MAGVWRRPKTREQVSREADEALRKQCLTWAFQTRDFRDVPHMDVVNVAQGYYDFIRSTPARQAQLAWWEARQRATNPEQLQPGAVHSTAPPPKPKPL